MKRLSCCLLLILFSFPLIGQDDALCCDQRGKRLSLAPHYGFIIPHTAQMSHLIQGHSYGLGAQWMWGARKDKNWNSLYNYPDQGIDVFFNHTGNPQQLGYQLSCSYFVDLPLNRLHAVASIPPVGYTIRRRSIPFHFLGLGIGVGYASRRWDLMDNRQAAVIGSRLNAAISVQYRASVLRTRHSELSAGLRITHFSNGAFRMPNLGTNNASVYLTFSGLSGAYASLRERLPAPMPSPFSGARQLRATLSATMGLKEIAPPNGKQYPSYTFGLLLEYQATRKSIFGAGADIMYNSSIGKLLERRDGNDNKADIVQAGAVISYSLLMNRFEVKFQQGFYLLDRWKEFGTFYHRFGLRYRFTEQLLGHLTLKTHFAKADHGELGIAWVIHRSKPGHE